MVLLLCGIYLIKHLLRGLEGRRTALLRGHASGVTQSTAAHSQPVVEFETISEDIYTVPHT